MQLLSDVWMGDLFNGVAEGVDLTCGSTGGKGRYLRTTSNISPGEAFFDPPNCLKAIFGGAGGFFRVY